MDKFRLLTLEREQAGLEGELAGNQARIAQLRIQIGETRSQLVLREHARLAE